MRKFLILFWSSTTKKSTNKKERETERESGVGPLSRSRSQCKNRKSLAHMFARAPKREWGSLSLSLANSLTLSLSHFTVNSKPLFWLKLALKFFIILFACKIFQLISFQKYVWNKMSKICRYLLPRRKIKSHVCL